MAARIAFAAYDLRLDRHPLPNSEAADVLAEGDDLSGDLMTLGYRILRERMLPMVDMDVTSTYTYVHYPNQNLVVANLRQRDLSELNLPRFRHDLLNHRLFHTYLDKRILQWKNEEVNNF